MSDSETVSNPQAGQIWTHDDNGYDIQVTRVTDNHVHYTVDSAKAADHAESAREFLREKFGYSLAYIAPTGGSCCSPAEFDDQFTYKQDRPKEQYESW